MKTLIHIIFRRTASSITALLAVMLMIAAVTVPVFADSPEEQADRIIAGMETPDSLPSTGK
jgi:hypothetical protein